jgi:glycine/D-amino acid oxidase-like deaminating enzyme
MRTSGLTSHITVLRRDQHQKICVIGGGLGGLSIASKLAHPENEITIYDPHEPGFGGASAVAAGLLHPLTPKGNLIWMGDEGLKSTEELIQQVEIFSKQKIQHKEKGIIRPLLEDHQYERYRKSSKDHPEVELFSVCCSLTASSVPPPLPKLVP